MPPHGAGAGREFTGRPWLWGIVAPFSVANAVVGAPLTPSTAPSSPPTTSAVPTPLGPGAGLLRRGHRRRRAAQQLPPHPWTLTQLRAAGADVAAEDTQEMNGVGRFGWVTDPEGNRIEFRQPA